jgi:protein CMS1
VSFSALTHIILDVTFRDAKKRALLDIPETRDEVFKTVLGGPRVREALQQGKVQVVLF